MQESRVSVRPVVAIAGAGVFGAFASMVTIALGPALQPSFPILSYLRFDPAEIIDMVALLLFGPIAGTLTATVHFIILSFAPGGTGPFGASLKYLAVLSTFVGVILVSRLGKLSFRRAGASMTISGLLVRVALTTLANYLYLIFLAKFLFGQDYAFFAQLTLSKAGINLTGSEFVTFILGLTAVFNAAHAVLTMVLSLFITGALLKRAPQWLEARAWFTNYIARKSD